MFHFFVRLLVVVAWLTLVIRLILLVACMRCMQFYEQVLVSR